MQFNSSKLNEEHKQLTTKQTTIKVTTIYTLSHKKFNIFNSSITLPNVDKTVAQTICNKFI